MKRFLNISSADPAEAMDAATNLTAPEPEGPLKVVDRTELNLQADDRKFPNMCVRHIVCRDKNENQRYLIATDVVQVCSKTSLYSCALQASFSCFVTCVFLCGLCALSVCVQS